MTIDKKILKKISKSKLEKAQKEAQEKFNELCKNGLNIKEIVDKSLKEKEETS